MKSLSFRLIIFFVISFILICFTINNVWADQPDVTIVFSGDMSGYYEPCKD